MASSSHIAATKALRTASAATGLAMCLYSVEQMNTCCDEHGLSALGSAARRHWAAGWCFRARPLVTAVETAEASPYAAAPAANS